MSRETQNSQHEIQAVFTAELGVKIILGDEVMYPVDHTPMRPFIIATWVNSARKTIREKHKLSASEYNLLYPPIVETIVDNTSNRVISLSTTYNGAVSHGWIVSSHDGVILYAYVPPELRRFGLFKAMCEVIQWLSSKKESSQPMTLACQFPFSTRSPHKTMPHLPTCIRISLGKAILT